MSGHQDDAFIQTANLRNLQFQESIIKPLTPEIDRDRGNNNDQIQGNREPYNGGFFRDPPADGKSEKCGRHQLQRAQIAIDGRNVQPDDIR